MASAFSSTAPPSTNLGGRCELNGGTEWGARPRALPFLLCIHHINDASHRNAVHSASEITGVGRASGPGLVMDLMTQNPTAPRPPSELVRTGLATAPLADGGDIDRIMSCLQSDRRHVTAASLWAGVTAANARRPVLWSAIPVTALLSVALPPPPSSWARR